MDLAAARAVVAGGASGLGLATAERVAAAGARVALLDCNEEQGTARAQALGDGVTFLRTDVADEAAVQAAIAAAAEAMDGITLAVNCAGIATAGRTLGRDGPWPAARFNRVLQINLLGSYNVTKEAAAIMADNEPNADGERGVVINTASIAAFEGQIGQAAYAASKGAVVGMTLPLAREFARHGIRVAAIAPGLFETPMAMGLRKEALDSMAADVPFPQRFGRPEEFARLVQQICENPMLNGEVIRLDGAFRMGMT